jgi:hypothetical protein
MDLPVDFQDLLVSLCDAGADFLAALEAVPRERG